MEAPLVTDGVAAPSVSEASLTDHDIYQLLLEAEGRLRAPPDTKSSNDSSSQPANISKLSLDHGVEPYIRQKDESAGHTASLLESNDAPRTLNDPKSTNPKTSLSAKDKPNAGKDWFNLPKTELTPELKRDLQLLRMRSVLDPKRHYKKESKTAQPPEFSQIGTIIEGPTEFFSARITKKDRKRTFVDETLATERLSRRFDAKYRNIQLSKQSGRKAFYKGLKEKRKPKGR